MSKIKRNSAADRSYISNIYNIKDHKITRYLKFFDKK